MYTPLYIYIYVSVNAYLYIYIYINIYIYIHIVAFTGNETRHIVGDYRQRKREDMKGREHQDRSHIKTGRTEHRSFQTPVSMC